MDKIKLIHDKVGQTITVWFDEPSKEAIAEETADEVVLMKDAKGRVIGFELLNYRPATRRGKIAVETVVRSGT